MFWKFLKGRSELNAVEKQVLDAIVVALPDGAAKILRAQLSLIDKVQRINQDREVDFYHIEKGKPAFPDHVLFANRAQEFELATVQIADFETGHQSEAVVSLVRGHLFCIEFSQTPRDLRGSNNLKVKIKRLGNPTIADPPAQTSAVTDPIREPRHTQS